MAEDQLRSIVDGIRTHLQAELDAQLNGVAESYDRALAEVRRTAEEEADRRWSEKLERERADWNGRLESEVAAARSEVERRMVAEAMRARLEAEQASADAASRARHELEQAVASERTRAQQEIDRLKSDVDALHSTIGELKEQFTTLKERGDRELVQAREALEAVQSSSSASAEPSSSADAGTAGILEGVRAIDDASSLSTTLGAVTRAALSHAPRAAMFVVHGTELREWPVEGVPPMDASPIRADGREAGFLSDVLRSGDAIAIGANGGVAPHFARLSAGRSAFAVPVTLGGQPVAVLYADDGNNGQPARAWQDAVHILGRHASRALAYLTAMRTTEAMHFVAGSQAEAPSSDIPVDEEAQGARRYARLLVSEIKLYNEGAVRVGRERRDLMRRLKAEIERAQRLYSERVPDSIRGRDTYFQQELVQTLADGDPSLLG